MELCEMELGKDVQTSQFFSSNQQAQKISAPPETSILLRIIKCIENSGVFPALYLLWAIIWVGVTIIINLVFYLAKKCISIPGESIIRGL